MTNPPTLTILKVYVATLSKEMQEIFWSADDIEKCTEDTLSEEYQLASTIRDVFAERAKDKQ